MKSEDYNLEPVEGLSIKPFYLKSPKMNIRAFVVSGIMLLIMAIIYPYLFVVVPFYFYFIFKKVKYYKSEPSVLLHEAIDKYLSDKPDESLILLNKLSDLEPDNLKCNILKSLIYYSLDYYEKSIEMLEKVPQKIINNDLDLLFKLADSYLKSHEKDKAIEVYNTILRIYPNSKFIKDILEDIKQ
jgi:tetratricopeptide (TPR) repeat protein